MANIEYNSWKCDLNTEDAIVCYNDQKDAGVTIVPDGTEASRRTSREGDISVYNDDRMMEFHTDTGEIMVEGEQ